MKLFITTAVRTSTVLSIAGFGIHGIEHLSSATIVLMTMKVNAVVLLLLLLLMLLLFSCWIYCEAVCI
jgi:hypothetical protein